MVPGEPVPSFEVDGSFLACSRCDHHPIGEYGHPFLVPLPECVVKNNNAPGSENFTRDP